MHLSPVRATGPARRQSLTSYRAKQRADAGQQWPRLLVGLSREHGFESNIEIENSKACSSKASLTRAFESRLRLPTVPWYGPYEVENIQQRPWCEVVQRKVKNENSRLRKVFLESTPVTLKSQQNGVEYELLYNYNKRAIEIDIW